VNLFGDRLGAPGWELLSVLNDAGLFVSQVIGGLIPQAIVAVCYWGWLVTWWLRHQQAHTKVFNLEINWRFYMFDIQKILSRSWHVLWNYKMLWVFRFHPGAGHGRQQFWQPEQLPLE
jgi:hypothetical protein